MRARTSQEERPVGFDGHSPVPLPEDVLSGEEIEEYLSAVASGAGLDLAARSVGMTGTRMRRLARRDPVFQERVDAASAEATLLYADRLRASARQLATRPEPVPRILEVELATHVPGYEHLRRDRMKIDGRVEHSIVFDPSTLDLLTDAQKAALEDALIAMGGEVIDGEVRELGPGEM